MSALGHKRTYASQKAMSALPQIATAKADYPKNHFRFTPESGHVQCSSQCPLWAKSGHSHLLVETACGSDLRGAHRLSHAEEDHDALTAAARGQRLACVFVATVDVLPVVHHPDIARRRNRKISLHL